MPLPFPEFPEDSCINCGFLANHRGLGFSAELLETNRQTRSGGWFGQGHPVCFVLAPDVPLETEVQDILAAFPGVDAHGQPISEKERPGAIRKVITKDRRCKESTLWRPGYSPKEHREMLDRRIQRLEDHRWRWFELFFLGIVSVVIAGVFVILGAFIARSGDGPTNNYYLPGSVTAASPPTPSATVTLIATPQEQSAAP